MRRGGGYETVMLTSNSVKNMYHYVSKLYLVKQGHSDSFDCFQTNCKKWICFQCGIVHIKKYVKKYIFYRRNMRIEFGHQWFIHFFFITWTLIVRYYTSLFFDVIGTILCVFRSNFSYGFLQTKLIYFINVACCTASCTACRYSCLDSNCERKSNHVLSTIPNRFWHTVRIDVLNLVRNTRYFN